INPSHHRIPPPSSPSPHRRRHLLPVPGTLPIQSSVSFPSSKPTNATAHPPTHQRGPLSPSSLPLPRTTPRCRHHHHLRRPIPPESGVLRRRRAHHGDPIPPLLPPIHGGERVSQIDPRSPKAAAAPPTHGFPDGEIRPPLPGGARQAPRPGPGWVPHIRRPSGRRSPSWGPSPAPS
uniref:Uncharacterized protein n=1 Tax=Triticum urartu TaxID=4572 RepID=A0A8R7VAY6_TRIUA